MDYDSMTDDEFFAVIEEKYGKEWIPEDLKQDNELYSEYMKRVATGV